MASGNPHNASRLPPLRTDSSSFLQVPPPSRESARSAPLPSQQPAKVPTRSWSILSRLFSRSSPGSIKLKSLKSSDNLLKSTNASAVGSSDRTVSRDESRPRTIATPWDPTPLFQAYPQSVKHIELQAPQIVQRPDKAAEEGRKGFGARLLGRSKSVMNKKQQEELSPEDFQWAPKVYVLDTSGHLLQYEGAGPSDRLPEKVLTLQPNSLVLASDLVPGKDWVLQILNEVNEDTLTRLQAPKPFLAKLGLEGATARKMTGSFLMVFEGSESMETWARTIKREVKKLRHPTLNLTRTSFEPESPEVRSPSHRFMLVENGSTASLGYASSMPPTPASAAFDPASVPWDAEAELTPAMSASSGPMPVIASRSHSNYSETSLGDSPIQQRFPSLPPATPGHLSTLNRRRSLQAFTQRQLNAIGFENPPEAKLKRHSTFNDGTRYPAPGSHTAMPPLMPPQGRSAHPKISGPETTSANQPTGVANDLRNARTRRRSMPIKPQATIPEDPPPSMPKMRSTNSLAEMAAKKAASAMPEAYKSSQTPQRPSSKGRPQSSQDSRAWSLKTHDGSTARPLSITVSPVQRPDTLRRPVSQGQVDPRSSQSRYYHPAQQAPAAMFSGPRQPYEAPTLRGHRSVPYLRNATPPQHRLPSLGLPPLQARVVV